MNKFLSTVKYFVGIIMVLLLIIFQNNLYYAALDICIGMLLYGIIYVIEKNVKGILALIVSLSTLFSIILYKCNVLKFADAFTLFICLNILLMVDVSFLISRIRNKNDKKKNSLVVRGIVSSLEPAPNTKKKYLRPIIDYDISGNELSVCYPYYLKSNIPKVGDSITLYVNPDDYEDVLFDISKINLIRMIVSSVFVTIVCIVIIIGIFR